MRYGSSSPRRDKPQGFTLVELLVVIAIIALLAAIVMPGINGALRRSRTTATLNNLRQLGAALLDYEAQYHRWPRSVDNVSNPAEHWSRDILYPWLFGEPAESWDSLAGTIFTSPNAPRVGQTVAPGVTVANASNQGFGMNNHLPPNNNPWATMHDTRPRRIRRPSACMILMDCNAPHILGAAHFAHQFTSMVAMRHNHQNTVLFADMHARLVPHDQIPIPFHQVPEGTLFWQGND